jgi:phage repressor protein C with HTH and peptisase S24 domain
MRELARPLRLDYAHRMTSTLAANVKALRSALGLNQQAFAERLGVQQSYISKWEGGSVVPQGDSVAALAKLAGCSFDAFKSQPLGRADVDSADQPIVRSADASETAQISRLDLSLPMGPGATVDDYVEDEPLEFDLGYLRSFTRTPPSRLRLASGTGDSMFPTLISNDLVWIDTTQNQLLHSDRIYAASINGGAAIKRLRPVAGGARVLVISDNKTIDAYEVDANEVIIWGRVIRFARDL